MICESCNGYGYRGSVPCITCGGWGYNWEDEEEYGIKTNATMQQARVLPCSKEARRMSAELLNTTHSRRAPRRKHSKRLRKQMAAKAGGSASGGTALPTLPRARHHHRGNRG